jgi:hypothetical protein
MDVARGPPVGSRCPKWICWNRSRISALRSYSIVSYLSRDSAHWPRFKPGNSRLRTLNCVTWYCMWIPVLQNALVGQSVLCEQENYFLKLMVQWWVPVNDDVMERFVLDVILCKHWDRPAKSNNRYK